jgi:hypothetical protein
MKSVINFFAVDVPLKTMKNLNEFAASYDKPDVDLSLLPIKAD